MKSGLDRTLLFTKDLTDQGIDTPWILYLGEDILLGVDTWEYEEGCLIVFRAGKAIHACPIDSLWRLIRREMVDLITAGEAAKAGKRDYLKMEKMLETPPDDLLGWGEEIIMAQCSICTEIYYRESEIDPAEPCACGEMASGRPWDWDRWRGIRNWVRYWVARQAMWVANSVFMRGYK